MVLRVLEPQPHVAGIDGEVPLELHRAADRDAVLVGGDLVLRDAQRAEHRVP